MRQDVPVFEEVGVWLNHPFAKIDLKLVKFPHLRVNMNNYLKLKSPPSIASFTFVGGIDIQSFWDKPNLASFPLHLKSKSILELKMNEWITFWGIRYTVIPPSNYGIIIFWVCQILGVQFWIDPPSNQSQPIPSSNEALDLTEICSISPKMNWQHAFQGHERMPPTPNFMHFSQQITRHSRILSNLSINNGWFMLI